MHLLTLFCAFDEFFSGGESRAQSPRVDEVVHELSSFQLIMGYVAAAGLFVFIAFCYYTFIAFYVGSNKKDE